MLGTFVAGFGARDQTLIARLGAAQGRRVNALAAALVVCFATAAFAAWAGFTIAPMLSAPGRLLLAWLVLVLSIGTVSLLYLLLRRGAAAKIASLFYLVPPVTALFAWALFGETLGLVALAGMGLVAVGVALVQRN